MAIVFIPTMLQPFTGGTSRSAGGGEDDPHHH